MARSSASRDVLPLPLVLTLRASSLDAGFVARFVGVAFFAGEAFAFADAFFFLAGAFEGELFAFTRAGLAFFFASAFALGFDLRTDVVDPFAFFLACMAGRLHALCP